MSFRPDPNAVAEDAFSIFWSKHFVYMFAPVNTLNMVLRKIVEDETKALVIAPLWITQSWWPQLAHMIVDYPVMLPLAQKCINQTIQQKFIH